MTTLTRRGAHSGEQPPAASGDGDNGGEGLGKRSAWGRFKGSWGIALRMAKRDVRRHKGRSTLIMIMVALPTLLLVFAIVGAATSQIDGPEQIPSRMGNGVASLDYPQAGVVDQPFDPRGSGGSNGTATPIPGWVEGGSAFDNAQAVSSLTRTTVVPYLDESVSTRLADRRLSLSSLAIDPRPGLKDKVDVISGRLPERPGEALVSDAGKARGLPTTGTFSVRAQGEDVKVTVVGTAKALGSWGATYDLVVPQPFVAGQASGGWILLGSEPVKWPEVKRLNTYGFTVYSADVLRNPPPASELSADQRQAAQFNSDRTGTFVAIGGALLLIITTLLVGPAFAVSAARQRRTLALSASNGATTGQLRHTVLAQALVLGVLAALLGSVLGVGSAWLFTRSDTLNRFLGMSGPFEVPLLAVGLVTLAAVASAVIAALLPARRLGRLDIVGVMKGQNVSPRPSKSIFLIGAALAGVGGFAVISLAATQAAGSGGGGGEVKVVAASVALVVGAIMLAPMILVGIARLSSRLPVSLRMATRDAGRQRSRSVPAIAAILAGVAVLTMTLIASGSDNEQGRREYVTQNVPGDAKVYNNAGPAVGDFDVDALAASFATVRPGLDVVPVSSINTGDPWLTATGDVQPTKPYDTTAVNVVPPGCTPEQSVSDMLGNDETFGAPTCHAIGTQGQGNISAIGFTTTDELVRRLVALGREDDAAIVKGGGVIVGRGPGRKSVLVDGKVTVMSGKQTFTPSGQDVSGSAVRDITTVTLPAVEVELTKETIGTLLSRAMLVPTEVAQAQKWPTYVDQLTVHDPSGPITQNLTERLSATASDEIYIETERGYQSPMKWIILILIGVFSLLLLVITLTSTALTLAEQENDQATLAALGSGRGTRRIMAAAQAFTLCIIGAALGVAVGIVPGIALAYPLTAQSWNPITGEQINADPILVFPWLILLGFAIAVPAISAGLAAAGIRKAPDATHRTA